MRLATMAALGAAAYAAFLVAALPATFVAAKLEEESLGRPPGAVELAFEVEDVDSAHAAALAAGAPSFQAPADRYWGERTAYVLDPDGGLVELLTRVRR